MRKPFLLCLIFFVTILPLQSQTLDGMPVEELPTLPPVDPDKLLEGFLGYDEPNTGNQTYYGGLLFGLDQSETVHSTGNGVVDSVSYGNRGHSTGMGIYVRIRHGDNVRTVYHNLSTLSVFQGEEVKFAQPIGTIRPGFGEPALAKLFYQVLINGEAVDPRDYYYAIDPAIIWELGKQPDPDRNYVKPRIEQMGGKTKRGG